MVSSGDGVKDFQADFRWDSISFRTINSKQQMELTKPYATL